MIITWLTWGMNLSHVTGYSEENGKIRVYFTGGHSRSLDEQETKFFLAMWQEYQTAVNYQLRQNTPIDLGKGH
jgi:hypothetical protein